jgi:hypothetical protein
MRRMRARYELSRDEFHGLYISEYIRRARRRAPPFGAGGARGVADLRPRRDPQARGPLALERTRRGARARRRRARPRPRGGRARARPQIRAALCLAQRRGRAAVAQRGSRSACCRGTRATRRGSATSFCRRRSSSRRGSCRLPRIRTRPAPSDRCAPRRRSRTGCAACHMPTKGAPRSRGPAPRSPACPTPPILRRRASISSPSPSGCVPGARSRPSC